MNRDTTALPHPVPVLGAIFRSGAGNCHDRAMTSSTAAFREARDLLLRHRADYDAARREFAWPELDEFNWALDWFDVIAAEHPDRTGLRILAEDEDSSLTYGELAARSNQLGNRL